MPAIVGTSVAILLLAAAGVLNAAQPAPPAQCFKTAAGPGGNFVYAHTQPPTFHDIAFCAAPVLWLSPDEPDGDVGGPEPYTGHPCKGPSPVDDLREKQLRDPVHTNRLFTSNFLSPPSTPVVYYSFDPPTLDADARVPHGKTFAIRYSFYYPRDTHHCGDLETAVFTFSAHERHEFAVELTRAVGLAHGNPYFDNILQVRLSMTSLLLPLTLLVEEGTHATVPDRNADGVYTPGFDVNVNTHDAWGLRDNFASGVISPGFEASMSKPTRPSSGNTYRIFPPLPPLALGLINADPVGLLGPLDPERAARSKWPGRTYRLIYTVRETPTDPDSIPDGPYSPLRDLARKNQRRLSILASLTSFRYDGIRKGAAFVYPVLAGGAGGLPTLTIPGLGWGFTLRSFFYRSPQWTFENGSLLSTGQNLRANLSLVLSPSVGARFADYYFALGPHHTTSPPILDAGSGTVTTPKEAKVEYEVGLRLRWRPPKAAWLPTFGARVGVWNYGWSIDTARLVVEIGGGVH